MISVSKDRADMRGRFLDQVLWFVRAAAKLPGMTRIALIGSMLTDRCNPKDVDILVSVADRMDLSLLAALSRRLKGRLQSQNRGADIFLAGEKGQYLGRICPWKKCGPGLRVSCKAQHCGLWPYLHDDLATLQLDKTLVSSPPLELWPLVVRRCAVPADVERLIARLQNRCY